MDYDLMVRAKILRRKQRDLENIKSLINSAERISSFVRKLSLNDGGSTVIFREIYESIRQLGEAKWRLLGYEPLNHEISLDGLKEIDVQNKLKLNFLSTFKKIRNDANYNGIQISVNQAKEIIDFWDKCGKEVLEILKKEIKS